MHPHPRGQSRLGHMVFLRALMLEYSSKKTQNSRHHHKDNRNACHKIYSLHVAGGEGQVLVMTLLPRMLLLHLAYQARACITCTKY